jgi:hypothetical protein
MSIAPKVAVVYQGRRVAAVTAQLLSGRAVVAR